MYWDTLGARRLPLKPAIFPGERTPTDLGGGGVSTTQGFGGSGRRWKMADGRWQMAEVERDKTIGDCAQVVCIKKG